MFFPANKKIKDYIAIALIIVLSATLYLFTLKGVSGNPQASLFKNNLDQATQPFELSPERGRYAHVLALFNNGSYELSQDLADAVYPDVGYFEGKFYSYFAPGMSYLSLPFYTLGERFDLAQVFTFSFVSFISILSLLFLFKISRNIFLLSLPISLMVVLIYAFSSTAWSYAVTLYQHHLTSFFILSSFYAVWKYRQGKPSSFLWGVLVWLNYALAISIDYPNALLMLPVMIYFFLSAVSFTDSPSRMRLKVRWSFIFTAAAFILITSLHMYHNNTYFGSWSSISGTLVSYKTITEENLLEQPASLATINALADEKNVQGFFHEENIPHGLATLFISKDRGLFLFTPIFLLALIGMVYTFRRKMSLEMGIIFSLIAVTLFLYSSWGDPWGGWAYGPRYLIPIMPWLGLFIGVSFSHTRHIVWLKISTFILFLYSSAIALLGVLTSSAVPPYYEAVGLDNKYNFLLNLDFLNDDRSSSFIYNTFFSGSITLTTYFIFLYTLLIICFVLVLMKVSRHYEH